MRNSRLQPGRFIGGGGPQGKALRRCVPLGKFALGEKPILPFMPYIHFEAACAEIVRFGITSWSPGFGTGKNRFGTHWIIGVQGST